MHESPPRVTKNPYKKSQPCFPKGHLSNAFTTTLKDVAVTDTRKFEKQMLKFKIFERVQRLRFLAKGMRVKPLSIVPKMKIKVPAMA